MENRWETVEIVADFILGCSKITAGCDQPRQHIKSRDITLPTKVHVVKAMVFLVVMYGCESLTIKNSELQRIDAFELWC